jgi:predicted ATPase
MITKLTVRAFKGLREFSIEPRRVNLLIGANGTGKTNFADLIAFMAGVCRRGLVETIADFGGLSQVRTRRIGKGRPHKFEIELELGEDRLNGIQRAYYSFTLAQSNDIKIQREILDGIFYDYHYTVDESGDEIPFGYNYNKTVNLKYQRDGNNIISIQLPLDNQRRAMIRI